MQSSRTDSDESVSIAGLKGISLNSVRHDIKRIRSSQSSFIFANSSPIWSSHLPSPVSALTDISRNSTLELSTAGDALSKPPPPPYSPLKNPPLASQSSTPREQSRLGLLRDGPVRNTGPPRRHTKAEDPWSKTLVLSLGQFSRAVHVSGADGTWHILDGGDVRGFQTLMVLDQLMEAIRDVEGSGYQPKPCLYFDYIVGTGTGGLLAIMLGRLRMTINQCLEACLRLRREAFPRARGRHLRLFRPEHSSHALQQSIDQIVREHAPAALQRGQEDVFASDPVQCKTAVVSFNVKSGKPFVFRTYGLSNGKGTQENNRPDERIIWRIKSTPLGPKDIPERGHMKIHASLLRIADAARATSASPGYFTPFRLGSQAYVDSGLAANNPSLLMCSELQDIRKEAGQVETELDSHQEVSESSGTFTEIFVSIGGSKQRTPLTGAKRDSTRSILRRNSDLLRKMQALVELDSASSNETDTLMRSIATYFRLTTDLSLSLEDWQKARKREPQALFDPDPNGERLACAKQIVNVKQGRERTGRWTAFAGPLCYSREQLSAESSSSSSSSADSLGRIREASNKIASYSIPGGDESTRVRLSGADGYDALKVQNLSINAAMSHAPFQGISARGCAFIWRVPEFYEDLETPKKLDCFDNIVTINRISGDNYWACTCISFLESCWPEFGASILRLASRVCQVLSKEDAFQEDGIDCGSFRVNARATTSLLMFEPVEPQASGDASEAPSGSFQLLIDCVRWLICALMPSDRKEGLFRTNMVSVSKAQTYVIAFKSFDPCQDQSYCWTRMFSYAIVIDLGFDAKKPPVLTDRLSKVTENEPAGLKMDYELMWELAGVERAWEYDGGLVLNGFDTALVPLQAGDWPNHSRWHLWRTPGKRIKIQELDLRHDREKVTDLERFKGKSVHVGWVVESEVLLGTSLSAAAPDLRGSQAELVAKVMEKAQDSLAFQLQQALPHGGPTMAVQAQRGWNYQATLIPANRLNQFELSLEQSKTRQVILYDDETKNATLVPEIALLVFATLRYISQYGYTHFSGSSGPPRWEPIADLKLPSQCYDIATESEKVLLENVKTVLSKDPPGRGVILFKEVVNAMAEMIDRGDSACRKAISKKRMSGKKALYGFDLREAIRTEDIYLRRLKCTASMKAWAAAAEQTAVIFVNGLGGLVVPAWTHEDCMTTYPGLLVGTVLSLETEYSRNLWGYDHRHRRIKNTDFQWIIRGMLFSQCKHRDPAATTTCDDIDRIQSISQNSNFKAVFHRHKEKKRQLNVLGNMWTVKKEGMWSRRVWSDMCADNEWNADGAVRFGKVKSGAEPIPLRPHGVPGRSPTAPAPPAGPATTPVMRASSAAAPKDAGTSTSSLNGLDTTNGSSPSSLTKMASASAAPALGASIRGIVQQVST